jgi:hypothetical protein
VGDGGFECRVRNATDDLFHWHRFVAVGTVDDPAGCQVFASCPWTDFGSVPIALARHLLAMCLPEDARRAAVAALVEGVAGAFDVLAAEYPQLASALSSSS